MSQNKPDTPNPIPHTTDPTDPSFSSQYTAHQLSKISRLTISDLLKHKRTPTSPTSSPSLQSTSLLQQSRSINQQLSISHRYLGERTPGELWTNLHHQTLAMKSADFYDQRVSKTMNYVKRGRLGVDLYLIGFATLGLIGIPLYFYFVGKKERERKVRGRRLTPEEIRRLDEDSEVGIDEVSEQVIMYYNPEREARRREEMRREEEVRRVLREIEEM